MRLFRRLDGFCFVSRFCRNNAQCCALRIRQILQTRIALHCFFAQKNNLQPSVIIVDGYVWLDENQIGLGGHLYNDLGGNVAVIGVAKTKFKTHSKIKEVYRGASQTPLFVSAIGIDLDEAAQNIENMHGQFRLPTLLKRADQLCRGIITS